MGPFTLQPSSFLSQSRRKKRKSHSRGRSPSVNPSRGNESFAPFRKEFAAATPTASPVIAFVADPSKPKENRNLPGFNYAAMFSETWRSDGIADKKAKANSDSHPFNLISTLTQGIDRTVSLTVNTAKQKFGLTEPKTKVERKTALARYP
ncbi:MAG: hypothetical protein DHS80DRAFT_30642 [Piptocephalis tieghemiana]|nr:MAG: hypothetical protein DHS80DRAFT_30642 [Piptocephalis tieghemiana]